MMIKIDSNNIITAWCTVGGIEGGLNVGNIPDKVKTAPIGKYKYVGGKFVVNADYVEPTATAEPTQDEINLDIDFRLTSLELGL